MKLVVSCGFWLKFFFNKSLIKLKDNCLIIYGVILVYIGVRVFDKMEIVNEDRIERIGV